MSTDIKTLGIRESTGDVIVLDTGSPLTTAMLERAARPVDIELTPDVRARIAAGHDFVTRHATDHPVYGLTTGFGPLVEFPGREDAADQCENTLQHLHVGQGPDLEPVVVRATMLVRLWSLCRGYSGVTPGVADTLIAALATDVAPAVPRLGSLGASGDLIPLAHLADALRGNGWTYSSGNRKPAADALREAGLRPLELRGRDGLALVNGTSLTAAVAGLAVASVQRSMRAAIALSALLSDIVGAAPGFADPLLLEAFGHRDAQRTGADLRSWLSGTVPTGTRPLQEPYSIRCTPQLIGAVRSALGHVSDVVGADLNGVSDNPLSFPEHGVLAHGGNFFGQPVAFAADLVTLLTTQLATLAERQLDLLVDPHRNGGLPPMLSPRPGHQHAVQGVQLAATAMVAEMRRTVTPASAQSLPTNLHNQDVVPFGTQAALNALDHARLLRLVHGALAVALRQAGHLSGRPTAPACVALLDRLAAAVRPIDPDRHLDTEMRVAAVVLDVLPEPPELPRPWEEGAV